MLVWLTNDLASTTQRWIIAYWHAPPYTKGTHDSDGNYVLDLPSGAMRSNALPVLEAHGVDLVLSGHSHVYERTWPLYGHYGPSSFFSVTNKLDAGDGREDGTGPYRKGEGAPGTIYVTAALGCNPGTHLYSPWPHPAHYLALDVASSANEVTNSGSLVIDVASNRLDFKFITGTGATNDWFTLLKSPLLPPVVVVPAQVVNGVFTVGFQGSPGLTYSVLQKDSLEAGWVWRTNLTAPADRIIQFQENITASPQRFYRAVFPPASQP
jgi:hypothetical protein